MMTARPTKISLEGSTLTIQWSDGTCRLYEVADLRRNCPCAGCRGHQMFQAEQQELPEVSPDVRITAMTPAGNYAYKIDFSDGHNTGIFTLDFLRQLGSEAAGS